MTDAFTEHKPKCPECKANVIIGRDGSLRCPRCGYEVSKVPKIGTVRCPRCGSLNYPRYKPPHCTSCGYVRGKPVTHKNLRR